MNEIQEAVLLGAKEIHNLREQNKELQKRLDFMIEQNDKKQQILDKIKEYIKEEKEEYEKGKEDYKRIGIEQYTKGQLVAYKHIEELLEEID